MRRATHQAATALVAACVAFSTSSAFAQELLRGPYLQTVTPTAITVRWRTDESTDSVVRYGTAPDTLNQSSVGQGSGTEHAVTVSGLSPGMRYYYSVGNGSGGLAGGTQEFHFRTAPSDSADSDTRIWVVGDSGTADSNAAAVRDAFLNFAGNERPDLWLMLGDNAYENGTDAEYQDAVFDMYPTLLRNTPLWPTLGNHDGRSAESDDESGPYYDIFTLPRNAEAGGLASGTEAYYSFDYGNIHFVTLDSYETDRSENGAMLEWLENDLASTTRQWLIAFWHHPPYSKGSHDSDAPDEDELIEMRERAVPILESYGVDLVLNGHSHSYERSFLIDGHYGTSDTLDSSMVVDDGSGRKDDTGAYRKSTTNPNEGAVYAVAGSSGKTGGGALDHPVMYLSLRTLGSMVLDIGGNRLDAAFIDNNGVRRDYFTIEKGVVPVDPLPPSSPENLTVVDVTQASLTLNWDASTDNVAVAGYRVVRDGDTIATVDEPGFDDTGLTAGTRYEYSVIAFDAAGNESSPATVAATTDDSADSEAPTAVGELRATNVTASTLRLEWHAASDNVGVTGYRVSRGGVVLDTTDALLYVDAGLDAGTSYDYSVIAVDAAGNASAAASVTVTTEDRVDESSGGGGGMFGLFSLCVLAAAIPPLRRKTMSVAGLAVLLSAIPPPLFAHAAIDEQIAAVNAKLAREPGDADLLVRRGVLHQRHGDWQLALEDFDAAARNRPPDEMPEVFLHRSRTLFHLGDMQEADNNIAQFIVRAPGSSAGYLWRARIRRAEGKTDRALDDYARAIRATARPTPSLYLERARVLLDEPSRQDELLAGIDEGIDELGPLVSLIAFAVRVDTRRDRYAGALARIELLPPAVRDQPRWLHRRSELLLAAGRLIEARAVNRNALRSLDRQLAARGPVPARVALRRQIESSYTSMVIHSRHL